VHAFFHDSESVGFISFCS